MNEWLTMNSDVTGERILYLDNNNDDVVAPSSNVDAVAGYFCLFLSLSVAVYHFLLEFHS